jgi:hypothetical protein
MQFLVAVFVQFPLAPQYMFEYHPPSCGLFFANSCFPTKILFSFPVYPIQVTCQMNGSSGVPGPVPHNLCNKMCMFNGTCRLKLCT